MITSTIAVAAVVLALVCWFQRWIKHRNMPPGPTPLLLLGNILEIHDGTNAVDVTRIGKKYGEIFTVQLFTAQIVVLNSYKVIKEALVSPDYAYKFSGKGSDYVKKEVLPDDIIFGPVDEGQQNLRRVAMRGVKQYGTALKNVEAIAQKELQDLVNNLREEQGCAVDPIKYINIYVTNIIMILVCGEHFDPSHRMFQIAQEVADDINLLVTLKTDSVLTMIPFARGLFPSIDKTVKRMQSNNEEYTRYVSDMRKDATRRHPDCLFEFLERECQKGHVTQGNIQGITLDMILAGVVTTSPSLYNTLLVLSCFPEVQKRARAEILKVVGSDRLPGLNDKQNLPYCHATMLEMFRYMTPIPLAGTRTLMENCTFRGYFIPQGTQVSYNVYNVHHDEEFWEKPFQFDPTRFLDTEGNLVPPEDELRRRLLTFGVGKRSCIGETLARVRIFLAMTAILQNFDLKEDPNHPLPSADPRTYYIKVLTVAPSYKVRFIPRDRSVK